MRTYRTSELASLIGVHPNTVRLYESLKLIPRPERLANGYRVFTDLHVAQFRLARTAFEVEVLQNGLRKKMIAAVKRSAAGDYDAASALIQSYLKQLHAEKANALEAIDIATHLLAGDMPQGCATLKRKDVSQLLGVSMDALRNWEMNGLLRVRRRENGYRVYTQADIQQLKMIRSLRCGGYSLEAILRMLTALSADPGANVQEALDTPRPEEDIVSVCDRLITSLTAAEENANKLLSLLSDIKRQFS